MLACKGVVVQGRRRREKGGRGKPKGTRSAHLAKLCGRSSNAQTLAQTHTHWTGFQLAEGASGRFPLSLRPWPAPSIPPAPLFTHLSLIAYAALSVHQFSLSLGSIHFFLNTEAMPFYVAISLRFSRREGESFSLFSREHFLSLRLRDLFCTILIL